MNVSKTMKRIITAIVVVILCIILGRLIISRYDARKEYYDNISALTDSLKVYKTKSGALAAEKTLYVGRYSDLKRINDSLYAAVEDMGVKKPNAVVGTIVRVINPQRDTVWHYEKTIEDDTTTYRNMFDFSDKWRILQGSVSYNKDSMRMHVDKDAVNFKYALAIKDNKVYMKSDNPYVKFDDATGLVIPKPKKKHWGIGPTISYGYDAINNRMSANIGIGIHYNILSW